MKLFTYLACFVFVLSFVSAGVQICIDLDVPSAPSNLKVSGSVGSILLEWDEAVDTPSCSGIDKYVVSREGVKISVVDGDVLSFIDKDDLSEGGYVYTVYAVDLVGHNNGSAVKNVISLGTGGYVTGGGGGGSSRCYENWICEGWGECIDGHQNRECFDAQKCGTIKDKPIVLQVCDNLNSINSTSLGELNEGFNISSKDGGITKGFFSVITGAVIGGGTTSLAIAGGFIILILGGFGFVRMRRKRKLRK